MIANSSARYEKALIKIVLYFVNTLLAFLIIAPVLYALIVSIMPPDQIFEYPPKLIPKIIYYRNFSDALKSAPIFRFILNSLFVSVSITAGQIITCSLAAYAFAFMELKGKKVIFMIILSTMMIPGQTIIISNYLTISSLNMLDSYQALIFPYLSSAFGIFLLRQAFLTLPRELHEAAMLDGCGNFRFLMHIVIPLSKPAIGSLGIYQFINAWNMYMWPLLVTNSDKMRTVQIGIGMLQNIDSQSFGPIMAGIVMILVPSILAFVLGQKQLIAGLTEGSVKS
ncbi:MAG TPA: carbohydrate ABC transporter permease [Clostridiaceae bacterium]|nr:carbohydrate ABC transporter permease [Clostridiaceae bacterium]